MKAKDFEKNSKQLIDHCYNLLFSKAKEYASDEDRLANFKQPTSLFGVTPPEICLYYDSKHIASMVMIAQDIKKGKLPSRELLQEKVGDYINYGLLFYSTVIEMIEEQEKDTQKWVDDIISDHPKLDEPLVTLVLENCEELTFRKSDVAIEYSYSVMDDEYKWVKLYIKKDAELFGAIFFGGEGSSWKERMKLRDVTKIVIKGLDGVDFDTNIVVPWEDEDKTGEQNKLETIWDNGVDMVYEFNYRNPNK